MFANSRKLLKNIFCHSKIGLWFAVVVGILVALSVEADMKVTQILTQQSNAFAALKSDDIRMSGAGFHLLAWDNTQWVVEKTQETQNEK